MVDAFVEHISNPTVVVRAGEGTTEPPMKYTRTIFGERVRRGHLVLKGYDRELDTAFFRAIMRVLFQDGFRVVQFERMKGRPRTVFLTLCKDGVAQSLTVFHRAPAPA